MSHDHIFYPNPIPIDSFEGSSEEVAGYFTQHGVPASASVLHASHRESVTTEAYQRTKCTYEVISACNDDQGRAGEKRRMTCVDLDEKEQEIPDSKRTGEWCHKQRPDE